MAYSGRFRPNNPEKYKGDVTKIRWRSTWELKVFRRCDDHPDIVWWQSEEIAIPYMNPAKNKGTGGSARYFPDIVYKKRVGENLYEIVMVEIKPKGQTRPPDISRKNKTPTGRVSRRYINETVTYAVNEAKWKAAERYCRERGWKWLIMTEDDIQPLKK
jgi:hypothetical protein